MLRLIERAMDKLEKRMNESTVTEAEDILREDICLAANSFAWWTEEDEDVV